MKKEILFHIIFIVTFPVFLQSHKHTAYSEEFIYLPGNGPSKMCMGCVGEKMCMGCVGECMGWRERKKGGERNRN